MGELIDWDVIWRAACGKLVAGSGKDGRPGEGRSANHPRSDRRMGGSFPVVSFGSWLWANLERGRREREGWDVEGIMESDFHQMHGSGGQRGRLPQSGLVRAPTRAAAGKGDEAKGLRGTSHPQGDGKTE